mmetsp:Transcript_30993/g.81130  ORF Transcript_30993/g.81130 Transcript_30993/m.81130 type:complete len:195 (+) Transcript_30993:109-693(+)
MAAETKMVRFDAIDDEMIAHELAQLEAADFTQSLAAVRAETSRHTAAAEQCEGSLRRLRHAWGVAQLAASTASMMHTTHRAQAAAAAAAVEAALLENRATQAAIDAAEAQINALHDRKARLVRDLAAARNGCFRKAPTGLGGASSGSLHDIARVVSRSPSILSAKGDIADGAAAADGVSDMPRRKKSSAILLGV